MKYSEVLNFNPIETVIQINEADNKDKAKSLIESYVISDEMVKKIDGIVTELQFEEVIDNKGVLIVGNYGTGKSHLMSVVSSIANDKENLSYLKNEECSKSMKKIAGNFEVLRIEIGASENTLRNMVVLELEKDLMKRGISYKFPDASTIVNNKEAFFKMMACFEEKYPDKGYLLVIDELLDYLRAKKEHELILDLNFLREIGEFIKNSRFRLICGIQEQLFENSTFAYVAQSLNRVKDRFEQVIIRKEDTAFVVSERLLGKTIDQKAKVREHLLKFCSLYSGMSERLDEFVDLFPIHPAYIDTFNKVSIAEHRQILKTISLTVRNLIDTDVPEEFTGLISFDSYWNFIKDNYARKSDADIREVMEKSAILEDKIIHSFPANKKSYKEMALQIINALSVYRLTTAGIDVPIGLTVDNFKDDLCLFIKNMPEMDPEFLLSIIQTVLKEITNLVSGQFIELNKDNGQYYLDLKKDIDYDAKISQKAETLSNDDLNRYYFNILYDCLEWDEKRYVDNFQIYEYRLNWNSHNVFRRGYLFMGVPNGRSTAQPPRDFYINMIPPYGNFDIENLSSSDEVMFKFLSDDEFKNTLMLYGAALSMKDLAGEQNTKIIYVKKANEYKKILLKWLNEHKNTSYTIEYKAVSKQLIQITKGKGRSDLSFKDIIDLAASICLDEYFESVYPDFPVMKNKITFDNQAEVIQRAIRFFTGQKSSDSIKFLESFNLIENSKINIENSKYAMYLSKQLDKLQPQGVINYSDIIEEVNEEYIDKKYKINLEYYSVVLMALVYCGKANITLNNGKTITVSNLDSFSKLGLSDIIEFKYLSKPKGNSLDELKKLFEILDISTALLMNSNEIIKGLEKALQKTRELADKALTAKTYAKGNFVLWGEKLIPSHIVDKYLEEIEFLMNEFTNFKNKYNNVAKLLNYNGTIDDLNRIEKAISYIDIINKYEDFKNLCTESVNYICTMETLELPDNLNERINKAKLVFIVKRDEISSTLDADTAAREVNNILNEIKKDYIKLYFEFHNYNRLGINGAEKKINILNSQLLSNLNKLSEIETIFSIGKLQKLKNDLSDLVVCYELTVQELNNSCICPHCKLKIAPTKINAESRLSEIVKNMDVLFQEWTGILLSTLEDPLTLENKELLTPKQKQLIDGILSNKSLPEVIDKFFVDTFNTLFSELDKVVIDIKSFESVLLSLGPCTVEELKHKTIEYIDNTIKGKDIEKLRLIVQKDNN